MAVTAAQRRQAIKDHNRKLSLERQLRPALRRLHRRMIRAYLVELELTGQILNFQVEFGEELRDLLLRHYNRIGDQFTKAITQQIFQRSIVISEHYTVRSVKQSRAITVVTQKHAQEALDVARAQALAEGLAGNVAVTELEIATNAGGIFARRLNGRETGLVMFETNWSAEAAKLTQVELIAGEAPSIVGGSNRPSNMIKSWANLGDSLVRTSPQSHLAAEQTVPANKPFIVGGEKLKFPGDLSLGASLSNVINCRCSAIYEPSTVVSDIPVEIITDKPIQKLPIKPLKPIDIVETTSLINFEKITTFKKDVTRVFKNKMIETWDKLPIEIQNTLVDTGITLKFAKKLENTIDNAETGKKFTGGLYSGGEKGIKGDLQIGVSEKYLDNNLNPLNLIDPGHLFLHENGHAIDDILKNMRIGGSDDKEYIKAWKKTKKDISSKKENRLFDYFLSDSKNRKGIRESFAESFSHAIQERFGVTDKSNAIVNTTFGKLFKKNFKDEIKIINKQINKLIEFEKIKQTFK